MKNLIFASLLSFTCLSLTACKQDATTEPTSPGANRKGGEGHAPSGVVPGSHEDWCGEHQVPESLCTRCNPSLSAAFKATNDWCDEHGLPESQCKICNPGLSIVRPPPKQAH